MHDNHDHSHSHSHSHSHDHEHRDSHSHDSDSDAVGADDVGASKKDVALLTYMLEHNKQHARELSEVGARLAESGFEHAADMIADAVHYFDHANDSLEIAVSLIG